MVDSGHRVSLVPAAGVERTLVGCLLGAEPEVQGEPGTLDTGAISHSAQRPSASLGRAGQCRKGFQTRHQVGRRDRVSRAEPGLVQGLEPPEVFPGKPRSLPPCQGDGLCFRVRGHPCHLPWD